VVADDDRDRAVLLAPGRGRDALADLALDHHQHSLDLRRRFEEPDHHRGRHVVGEVRHARPRPVGQQGGEVHSEGVADGKSNIATVRDDRLQDGRDPPVALERDDPRPVLEEGEGQRSQPGPDLEDPVAGAHAGEPGDAPSGVRVGEEVLPERA
jgi:hypothetical protein